MESDGVPGKPRWGRVVKRALPPLSFRLDAVVCFAEIPLVRRVYTYVAFFPRVRLCCCCPNQTVKRGLLVHHT